MIELSVSLLEKLGNCLRMSTGDQRAQMVAAKANQCDISLLADEPLSNWKLKKFTISTSVDET